MPREIDDPVAAEGSSAQPHRVTEHTRLRVPTQLMEHTPRVGHPDLDQLLNVLLPFAEQMLDKYGEFLPFGAVLTSDGEVRLFAGYAEPTDSSTDVAELIRAGFRESAQSGEIVAIGLCLDVRVARPDGDGPIDAICAELEHSCGEAVDVFLPYVPGPPVTYGEIFASPGKRRVFGAGDTG